VIRIKGVEPENRFDPFYLFSAILGPLIARVRPAERHPNDAGVGRRTTATASITRGTINNVPIIYGRELVSDTNIMSALVAA
jgi:hypothetical protein